MSAFRGASTVEGSEVRVANTVMVRVGRRFRDYLLDNAIGKIEGSNRRQGENPTDDHNSGTHGSLLMIYPPGVNGASINPVIHESQA